MRDGARNIKVLSTVLALRDSVNELIAKDARKKNP
jgi:hypothetical protein